MCEAVQRLLDGEGRVGATAPGAAFDARGFLQALAPDHLSLEIDAGWRCHRGAFATPARSAPPPVADPDIPLDGV